MTITPTGATRIAELEADNRRLRRLLEQRDAAGELRHRLRSTVALLLGIIRKSSETKREIELYVGHLEDRIAAIVRAQSAADEHGSVDLRQLVEDELMHYRATESKRLTVTGNAIELKPRAGQILALAIHELAVNAIEHGALGSGKGSIAIDWRVTEVPDKSLIFVWSEMVREDQSTPSYKGFGTDVLTRMLQYELRAVTDIAFEPDYLRCTIRIPWHDGVGQVSDV